MWVRNNKGNVFIGNLPPDFSDERLAEAFDPFGIVLSAAVARDPDTGAKLRYGFVDIATERAASKAITALHGTEIDGCKLNVKASERKAKKPPGAAPARRAPMRAPPPRRTPYGGAEPRPFSLAQPGGTNSAETGSYDAPHAPTGYPGNGNGHAGSEGPGAGSGFGRDFHETPAAGEPRQSQSSRVAGSPLDDIGPPPRRDFEVAYKPARRKTPSFQVERRPLPRRV